MPIYEVILHKPDGHDETRLTDRQPRLNAEITIDGQGWRVIRKEPKIDPATEARYVCMKTTPSSR